MSSITGCRIDQLGCVLHGFRDPKCKFFNYDDEPPAPRAGEWSAVKRAANMIDIVDNEGLIASVSRWRSGVAGTEREADELANKILTEHNQYATLIGQRERLLATLQKLAAFDDACGNMVLRKQGDYSGFDEPGAVRLARELLATIEREGV